MIRFRLADLIADDSSRERRVIAPAEIAQATGMHGATLSTMANQPGSNIGSDIIDRLCRHVRCQFGDRMTSVDDVEVDGQSAR